MERVTLILIYLAIPSLLFSAIQKVLSWKNGSKPKAKFPGPRQFPLVGRIHDLPRFNLWLKFKEWADEFGPIYYTKAVENEFIIVTDEKIAEELLVKRGHIYSGRPQIRSLIKHKEGPAYSALMDRHGKQLHSSFAGRTDLTSRRYLEDAEEVGSRCRGGSLQAPLLRARRG